MIPIDAYELNSIKDLIQEEQDDVAKTIGEVLSSPSAAKSFLDRYLSGQAVGKDLVSECALHASGRGCIYERRLTCYGCIFELRSKVSFIHYYLEYKRLEGLMSSQALTEIELEKNKFLAKKTLSVVSELLNHLDSVTTDSEMELYCKLYKLPEGEIANGYNECS